MILHQAAGLRARPVGMRPKDGTHASVLGIVSGKGGVGKSALAVNVATAAAAAGAHTLLIDGDLGLANADLLMGLVPRHDYGDCVAQGISISEALCAGPAGLELLVAGSGPAAIASLERSLAGGGAEPLAAVIAARTLTILDLGAGIGAGVLDLARHCARVWLVATPEPTSLADAYTTAKHLWERAPALPLELLVNRAPDRESGERTHRALDRLTRRFLDRTLPLRAILPEDGAMIRAVARQRPVVLAEPAAPIARRLRLLAESLLEEHAALAAGIAPDSAPFGEG